jgi:hypothetical protein
VSRSNGLVHRVPNQHEVHDDRSAHRRRLVRRVYRYRSRIYFRVAASLNEVGRHGSNRVGPIFPTMEITP